MAEMFVVMSVVVAGVVVVVIVVVVVDDATVGEVTLDTLSARSKC